MRVEITKERGIEAWICGLRYQAWDSMTLTMGFGGTEKRAIKDLKNKIKMKEISWTEVDKRERYIIHVD